MHGTQWDAIFFNETWREYKSESDTLHNNCMWFGSGGTSGKHGVGILLHRSWGKFVQSWRAVSERLGVLEINARSLRLSLLVVYMPHSGYQDDVVQDLYDQLSQEIRRARSRKRMLLIGGDWNAEVQSQHIDKPKHAASGAYANPKGNMRGDWFRRWATSENYIIANTLFRKRWAHRWTHQQK
eukprot:10781249-Karenia_brevis.AAC.1